jgi:hypothetical protein
VLHGHAGSTAVACRLTAADPCHPGSANPARDVGVTRHLQRFPDSRPLGLPRTCGHHGWSSGPWALPRAPHPTGQEPATHVTAGTGRAQPVATSLASARPPRQAHSLVRPRVATQFTTPNALQCYAGTAPVTRRSGKRDLVVTHRQACNRYLADAARKWAFASLRRSPWARDYYDTHRARGHTHHAALRALANRWTAILRHCLTTSQPYSEAVHQASRTRALTHAALPSAASRPPRSPPAARASLSAAAAQAQSRRREAGPRQRPATQARAGLRLRSEPVKITRHPPHPRRQGLTEGVSTLTPARPETRHLSAATPQTAPPGRTSPT